MLPFYSTLLPPQPILNPCKPLICSPSLQCLNTYMHTHVYTHNMCVACMCMHTHHTHICNYTVCNLLGLNFAFSIYPSLKVHPSYCINSIVLLIGEYSLYKCTTVCLNILPLKDIWIVSSVCVARCYGDLCTCFCVNPKFSFLCDAINAQHCIRRGLYDDYMVGL